MATRDWKKELEEYIKDPSCTRAKRIRCHALKYTMIDRTLFHWTMEGLMLKCLSDKEAKVAMGEVHEGLCGSHQSVAMGEVHEGLCGSQQSAHKMHWMLRRVGVYWPTMLVDCFKYYKGCEAC
jgi:hypothetical protein